MQKILRQHKEQILYIIFGVLTTVISYGTYFLFTRLFKVNIGFSNILSWFISVIFAYITNRLFVFQSNNNKTVSILKEFNLFVVSRVFSGMLDTVLLIGFVNVFGISDIIMKVINGIIVIIINYLLSKRIIFKNREI